MKGSMERESKTKAVVKKPYTKPELSRYGSVAELTKGSGKSTIDGPGTKRSGG